MKYIPDVNSVMIRDEAVGETERTLLYLIRRIQEREGFTGIMEEMVRKKDIHIRVLEAKIHTLKEMVAHIPE